MSTDIKDCIEMIKLNAELSLRASQEILGYEKSDYFSKHKAQSIKAKSEDILKMVGALSELLKTKK